ncbi:Protein of unknown function [Cotesia congregata]|uniref:Uncharacterized protein n=1 Tax=Cotesia congregata TaxID=51543 RepID=A0A8J2H5P1_COTCN|nr:Protein of unknown function [Cotesia congregata]
MSTLWHTTNSQQSSQGSQNIIIETGRYPDQPSTSSNLNIMEVNNEEPVTAISSTLQNKRDRQKRYREKNREKLSQREAERRRRLQNAEKSIIIIDEVTTNSRNLTGLGEMEHELIVNKI